ncbi:MAG: histidine kinase [Anaerolineales bacterium]
MTLTKRKEGFPELLIDKYWIVPVFVGFLTLLFELYDHRNETAFFQNEEFLQEVLIVSVIFPIIIGIIIFFLKRIFQERNSLSSELNLKYEFEKELAYADRWENLRDPLAGYLTSIFPVKRLYLCAYTPAEHKYNVVASWAEANSKSDAFSPDLLDSFLFLSADHSESANEYSVDFSTGITLDEQTTRYEIPLSLNGFALALIFLDIENKSRITSEQIQKINAMIPDISLAVGHIYSNVNSSNINQMKVEERKRIGRVLHDTLVQDLSYLQLKIDLLRDQESLVGIYEVQKDLERMQLVAHNAYSQVRGTMDSLVSDIPKNLSQGIFSMAKSILEPANIQLDFENIGKEIKLTPETKDKILKIIREGCVNAQKHSGSPLVNIRLIWGESLLRIEIEDHGKGISSDHPIKDQHYGMIFMQERADAIQADLKMVSEPGSGTKIYLDVPIHD